MPGGCSNDESVAALDGSGSDPGGVLLGLANTPADAVLHPERTGSNDERIASADQARPFVLTEHGAFGAADLSTKPLAKLEHDAKHVWSIRMARGRER